MSWREMFRRELHQLERTPSEQFTPMQREILRAIELHGGVTSEMTERHGWTRRSIPAPEMWALIERKIVAPRVLTSQPLRVVYQLKAQAFSRQNDARIAKEARRLKLKEYAPGGFALSLRRELDE